MAEVEKADIEKLHERLNKMTDTCLTPIKVSVGKLEQRFDDLKIPDQPCESLSEHLAEHRKNRGIWHGSLAGFVFSLIKMGVVLAAGYLFGKKL